MIIRLEHGCWIPYESDDPSHLTETPNAVGYDLGNWLAITANGRLVGVALDIYFEAHPEALILKEGANARNFEGFDCIIFSNDTHLRREGWPYLPVYRTQPGPVASEIYLSGMDPEAKRQILECRNKA